MSELARGIEMLQSAHDEAQREGGGMLDLVYLTGVRDAIILLKKMEDSNGEGMETLVDGEWVSIMKARPVKVDNFGWPIKPKTWD